MIRYLLDEEKGESRELWEEAFPEDSRSFADYYFKEKIKDNKILVLEEEVPETDMGHGRIASMIHLNPYWIRAAGERWKVDYLVGVATRKDRRHRGYMRSLLNRMMEDMRNEGMPFCFLMPADEAIYRPFGFTYIYRQSFMDVKAGVVLEEREILAGRSEEDAGRRDGRNQAETLGRMGTPEVPGMLKVPGVSELPGMSQVSEITNMPDLPRLSAWMNAWLGSRYEVFAIRDEDYVCRLLKEIDSENGNFRLLYDQGNLVGMRSEWGLEKREQRLLYGENSYVEEIAPPKPAIMARIITPEKFVRAIRLDEAYAGGQMTICLEIRDPLIRQNDGLWKWHLDHGTSYLEPWSVPWNHSQTEPEGERNITLTIEELTFWLFGYGIPEAVEAAGLEHVVRTLRGVFLDEIV